MAMRIGLHVCVYANICMYDYGIQSCGEWLCEVMSMRIGYTHGTGVLTGGLYGYTHRYRTWPDGYAHSVNNVWIMLSADRIMAMRSLVVYGVGLYSTRLYAGNRQNGSLCDIKGTMG